MRRMVFLVGVMSVACLLGMGAGGGEARYWIFFKDKGVADVGAALQSRIRAMPERISRRWERAGWQGDEGDLPVAGAYVQGVRAAGGTVYRESRWLNAVSAWLTPGELDAVRCLPFVESTRPVASFHRMPEPILPDTERPTAGLPALRHGLDYGSSLGQLQMVQLPTLHDRGYHGKDVIVCMMDTGFRKDHEAFQQTKLIDEWDFVFNDNNVQDQPADEPGAESHGTSTWSVTGGRKDGTLIGGAFEAGFLLAKTEDIRSETSVEEDNWVAALEWADDRGVDIVSSSLGYSDWYTRADFDGNTAITSIAASAAAKRGILVVNSAGNEGPGSQTLSAPADAFGILAVGAVNPTRSIASFSSRGPTADGRTKPEVCAQGTRVFVASYESTDSFEGYASGTSFSCPITAGAAASLLSARRDWSPLQLREAIMKTATRASAPDNTFGWGIVQIADAEAYLPTGAVEIDFQPLPDQPASATGYNVKARIRAYYGLKAGALRLYYRTGGSGAFKVTKFSAGGGSGYYKALIPRQAAGSTVFYYLQASDTKGHTRRRPYEAPGQRYSFKVLARG